MKSREDAKKKKPEMKKPAMKKITPEDPDTRSADVVAENVERLREFFPEAFTEGQIDFEVLEQLLGGQVDEREEKYGLNWHGKRRARQLALTPSTGTLRPAPEESVDWDTTQNLMIEGDNLEVLKLLQKSYAGKVKLIYIDPPYNTGKDFVYPDDFRDSIRNYLDITGQVDGENGKVSSNPEASGRFHTDWLNMMYPRLILGRQLLQRDGLIAISVDDNELSNLIRMLAEVFGEENFLNTIVWVSNLKGRQISGHGAATTHEYIVLWSRNLDLIQELKVDVHTAKATCPSTYKGFDYEVFSDDKGDYVLKNQLYNTNSAFNEQTRPNLVFNILYNEVTGEVKTSSIEEDKPPAGFELLAPHENSDGRHRYHAWRWSRDKVEREYDDLAIQRSGATFRVYTKVRDHSTTTLKDLVTDINTTTGDTDIQNLFGQRLFSNPKPVSLIRLLVSSVMKDGSDALCLDFFAGSGTVGHAVMAQNAFDGGTRKYILVQLPECLDETSPDQRMAGEFCDSINKPRTIAELAKERLRRASKGLQVEHPKFSGDLGFRVFKLDHSNIRAWDPSPDDLEGALLDNVQHLREGRSEQDVLYELLLKLGLDLCVPIEERTIAGKTVHSVGAGTLFVCLPTEVSAGEVEKLALGIAAWYEELDPAGETTVVLRDSAFENDVAKTNLAAILEQHGLENVRSL